MSDSDFYQLLNSIDSGSSSSATSSLTGLANTASGIGVWSIIAIILAIVGGILVYFLFVKAKTEPKGKFGKWLKDFLSFKIMWIEPILKVVYYIATIFVILYSFSFLGLMGIMGGSAFLMFLGCLILGPIVVRIAYEMTMMFIMIWRNTRDIAENTKKK
ncbi:DUF4282 domain-containing protein [Candidatus Saccharibacteria bacterium]|nr:DUF4282 domain-containing protein [Candidatus Saccharibacteria bacterium]